MLPAFPVNALFEKLDRGLTGIRLYGIAPPKLGSGADRLREIGQLIGPAVAGGILLLAAPELVLGLNAITFAAAALFLTRLRGHLRAPAQTDDEVAGPTNVLGVLRDPLVRSLVLTSGGVMLVAGATNVAELVLVLR